MIEAIERLRKAHAAGKVTGIRIAAESGLPMSTVYDLLRYPEVSPSYKSVCGMHRAAESILGPDMSELDPV